MNRVFQEGFSAPLRTRADSKATQVQRFADRLERRHDQVTFCYLRDRANKSAKAIRAAAELRWRNQDA